MLNNMTSEKDLLKDAMRLKLEQKHKRFVSEKLGEEHPLSSLQEIKVLDAVAEKERRTNRTVSVNLAALIARQKRELKKQTEAVRGLEKLDLDSVTESIIELKDALEDVRANLASSIAALDPRTEEEDEEA